MKESLIILIQNIVFWEVYENNNDNDAFSLIS